MNHYFDKEGFYTFSAPSNPGALPPPNATRVEPPECGEHEWPRWLDNDWYIWVSMKGTVYFEQDGTKRICETHISDLPNGTLRQPPPDASYTRHNGKEWIRNEAISIHRNLKEAKTLVCRYTSSPLIYKGVAWDCDTEAINLLRSLQREFPVGQRVAIPVNNCTDIRLITEEDLFELLRCYDQRVVDTFLQLTKWMNEAKLKTTFEIDVKDLESFSEETIDECC